MVGEDCGCADKTGRSAESLEFRLKVIVSTSNNSGQKCCTLLHHSPEPLQVGRRRRAILCRPHGCVGGSSNCFPGTNAACWASRACCDRSFSCCWGTSTGSGKPRPVWVRFCNSYLEQVPARYWRAQRWAPRNSNRRD